MWHDLLIYDMTHVIDLISDSTDAKFVERVVKSQGIFISDMRAFKCDITRRELGHLGLDWCQVHGSIVVKSHGNCNRCLRDGCFSSAATHAATYCNTLQHAAIGVLRGGRYQQYCNTR